MLPRESTSLIDSRPKSSNSRTSQNMCSTNSCENFAGAISAVADIASARPEEQSRCFSPGAESSQPPGACSLQQPHAESQPDTEVDIETKPTPDPPPADALAQRHTGFQRARISANSDRKMLERVNMSGDPALLRNPTSVGCLAFTPGFNTVPVSLAFDPASTLSPCKKQPFLCSPAL